MDLIREIWIPCRRGSCSVVREAKRFDHTWLKHLLHSFHIVLPSESVCALETSWAANLNVNESISCCGFSRLSICCQTECLKIFIVKMFHFGGAVSLIQKYISCIRYMHSYILFPPFCRDNGIIFSRYRDNEALFSWENYMINSSYWESKTIV